MVGIQKTGLFVCKGKSNAVSNIVWSPSVDETLYDDNDDDEDGDDCDKTFLEVVRISEPTT